jgi:rhodanese-related sulfurtransferase
VSRQIPLERWAALVSVAAASRSERVLVVCSSAAVRRQYAGAITKLGGRLDNVIFHILADERSLL